MKNFAPENLRKTILDMAYSGSTVHIACAFSLVEITSVLYSNILNLGSGTEDPNRDYMVLSKGHGVMALYACFKELGWLSQEEITSYFKDGTTLKGLSDCHVPGLEVTSGSLGHGLSVAVGIALGLKFRKSNQQVYCIVGDGEANEGTIWEALLFAAHWKLNNLMVIFDCNGYQAMGTIKEVMNLDSLSDKMKAFNFETRTVNGHSMDDLKKTFDELNSQRGERPKAVVAETVKGYGVSFMHANNMWHYTRLNAETYQKAVKELGF